MANTKKRPSKNAKAAQKLLNDSKLLAATKANVNEQGREFESSVVTPRANSKPMKARPDKKRG
jgi:hypothetical protein